MIKKKHFIWTAVLSLAFTAGSANAALMNGDFQAPDISGLTATVPNDWAIAMPATGGLFYGLRDEGPLADMARDQFFYLNQASGNSNLLFQDTGIVIVEGTTYILTSDVGEQGNQPDDDLARIGLYGSLLGTGTAFAELTDIDPEPTNTTSAWGTFQTQFTATAGQAGQTLGVYLGFGDGTGESGSLNASFDNVSVTTVPPVPECGSLALA